MKLKDIPTPYYIVYRDRLERNLRLIDSVRRCAGVNVIMAFKANALWPMFDIIRDYGFGATASSPNEMKLAREFLTDEVHAFTPAYTDGNIDDFLSGCTHVTFNSLSQWEKYKSRVASRNLGKARHRVSAGLRINPGCSVVETDIYNAALPGSRFGVSAGALADGLPEGIEGIHFHALCESGAEDLVKVLDTVEKDFAQALSRARWINMGGGHLMTRKGYDIDLLVETLQSFRKRHPHLEVILEPGSAFTWRTGNLETSVVDIVTGGGISTAIIDASFACHMPDVLEMPYKPIVSQAVPDDVNAPFSYRLGGNSCLSGDFCGTWSFLRPLMPGDRITLEDMNHYTTVKTTMFNGLDHPAIVVADNEQASEAEVIRQFSYQDYKRRMG